MVGDPFLQGCRLKGDCRNNNDCSSDTRCENQRCINPCEDFCGNGTKCEVQNHDPVCSCLPKWTGNPRIGCKQFDCLENADCSTSESCLNNKCVNACKLDGICGANSQCVMNNHTPNCICDPEHTGDPRIGCNKIRPCTSNQECISQMICSFGLCTGWSMGVSIRVQKLMSCSTF